MSSDVSKSCLFCDIIRENCKDKIIFEDDQIVAFPDIKPASEVHLLIVPKAHISNVKSLDYSHLDLLQHMISTAKNTLLEKKYDVTDMRFGFHWPPCTSISHLHLHAIAPVSQMSLISRIIFKENSWWFVKPEYVISRIEGMKAQL